MLVIDEENREGIVRLTLSDVFKGRPVDNCTARGHFHSPEIVGSLVAPRHQQCKMGIARFALAGHRACAGEVHDCAMGQHSLRRGPLLPLR